MITVEIKINGCLIGYIDLHRTNQECEGLSCFYEGKHIDIESGKSRNIKVKHIPALGYMELINKTVKKLNHSKQK